MATKTDILEIKLTTDGSGKVKAEIAGVGGELNELNTNTKNAGDSLVSFKSIIGGIAFGALTKGIIETNVEYQKLSASLKTVTGSTEAADIAFKGLEEFTEKTPFQLEEVVGSFIKLKALGLDPSLEALESYGNTASAMGKDLDQLIEAVADAATGEFERLKEFGIKSKSEGDKVSFTFRGVTTTVQKEAGAIEDYLRGLGENEFASGMTDQMDTLGAVFSNFEGSVGAMARTLGDAGLNEFVKELTLGITALNKEVISFVDNPNSMPEWLKFSSFLVKKFILELEDLGDIIGATAAILTLEVDSDVFDKIGAILEQREQKRIELEEKLKKYAIGINSPRPPGSNANSNAPEKPNVEEPAPFAKPERVENVAALNKEIEEYEKRLEKLLDELDPAAAATEKYMQAVADLDRAFIEGRISGDEYEKQIESLAEGKEFEELATAGEQAMARLEAASRGWGDAFTNALADMVQDGKLSFSDLADAIINDLLRILIYQNITAPIFGAIGLPGFSAAAAHGGGIAGSQANTRNISPLAFSGAQKFHTGGLVGLGPNEVPIIAQKGEEVLTEGDPRHRFNQGGGGSVKVEIDNKGTASTINDAQASFDMDGMVIKVFMDDWHSGGPMRQAIKGGGG